MRPFQAKKKHYVAHLDGFEAQVVAQLAADVAELLGASPAQILEALGGLAEDDAGQGEGASLRGGRADDGAPGAEDGPEPRDPWDLPVLGALESAALGMDPSEAPEAPEVPLDPALRRLLPSASEDPEVAAEFRRFTQVDLRGLKVARLLALVRALDQGKEKGRLRVPKDRADLLAGALVDIRLVLAERLGLDTDEAADALYEELAAAEAGKRPQSSGEALRLHLAAAYSALTWLQESLVTAQLADLDALDA